VVEKVPRLIISVDFYKQANGREPVREWLKSLKKEERRIIGEDIIWEVRSTLPNTIARVLFVMHDRQMVVLHGFIKKTQKTTQQDLETAISRAKEVKRG
jgi:phage-related protein